MSTATLQPRQLFDALPPDNGYRLAGDPETPVRSPNGGRPTLEDRISRVWEGLHADGAADCPVCQGRMRSRQGGGHCVDCGSELT
ncbi:MAG TPA: hypothetical protein VK304_09500 [Thermoleophilaceae bacterium]|nr:hypothetical protein [Thermoleophilaceae bacterium]